MTSASLPLMGSFSFFRSSYSRARARRLSLMSLMAAESFSAVMVLPVTSSTLSLNARISSAQAAMSLARFIWGSCMT